MAAQRKVIEGTGGVVYGLMILAVIFFMLFGHFADMA